MYAVAQIALSTSGAAYIWLSPFPSTIDMFLLLAYIGNNGHY